MDFLTYAIIIFLVLETANVLMLYFTPGTQRGNGLGVFKAYEESKSDPDVHALVKYLINWVANTKLIFIAIMIVIIVVGNDHTKLYAVGALCISISAYYFSLYPNIKRLDEAGKITPRGYSRTLSYMITAFLAIFCLAIIWVALPKLNNKPLTINGSWRLIHSVEITEQDTSVTIYEEGRELYKIINTAHFSFLEHDPSLRLNGIPYFIVGGGRYTCKGQTYTECIDYCSDPTLQNTTTVYDIEIVEDTLKLKNIEIMEKNGVDRLTIKTYLKIPEEACKDINLAK